MTTKRTRIKICGMTDRDAAHYAVTLGVDAIGMILHADSPRCIDLDRAEEIRAVVPAFVSLVGVFVDCPAARVEHIADRVGLDLIQLHGNETDEFGASLSRPFIKAIRARNTDQVRADVTAFPNARALLLDPYKAGQHGGTGLKLDTELWPQHTDQALILAGGLGPNNVVAMRDQLQPYAVDFNSGLESAPGIKDPELMEAAVKSLSLSAG